MTVDFLGAQRMIGHTLSFDLPGARQANTRLHCGTALPIGYGKQGLLGHDRYFDHQIDPVKQGAGDSATIAINLIWGAAACMLRMAKVAAWTRIHCRQQLESCRKLGLVCRAGNQDAAIFHRLAQHFEHLALELRQLVQKQYAMVRQ